MKEGLYTTSTISEAIRRSVKGIAAISLMNLGEKAEIENILTHLGTLYGTPGKGEHLLEQFYTSRQEDAGTVSAWACRAENMLATARMHGLVSLSEFDDRLKMRFWRGLKSQALRDATRHKMDDDDITFNGLVIEVRTIEMENAGISKPLQVTSKQGHVQQAVIPSNAEDGELTNLSSAMQKLSSRISNIERKPQEQTC